ncbi:hypothetical protein SAMN05216456_0130 [Devosia crocina]|uniref:Uncharacterized protein n=1 Tax=Devosia crocina TaxID=429728 RepID=A0A1I7MWQ2_9HYPH|nr:hypothetical protein [Devosia crocina]SFV26843.1 hypothetical protein SAMN05216456_0130 [Devosia crocina]
MYEVFDSYLNRDTWHAREEAEDEAFFTALGQVLANPGFDPDAMGDYMRQAKGLTGNSQDQLAGVINDRARDARAVLLFRRFNAGL